MSIKEEISSLKASPKELRKFGFTIGTVFLLITFLLFYKHNPGPGYFALGFTSVILLCAVIRPGSLIYFYKFWMALAICLSWVMTRVILGILFYVGFTFIKVIAKISGKEFLDLKIDKNKESYWIKREQKEFDKRSFERQF